MSYYDDPNHKSREWHKLLRDPQSKPLIARTPRNFILCLIATLVALVSTIQFIEWLRAAF